MPGALRLVGNLKSVHWSCCFGEQCSTSGNTLGYKQFINAVQNRSEPPHLTNTLPCCLLHFLLYRAGEETCVNDKSRYSSLSVCCMLLPQIVSCITVICLKFILNDTKHFRCILSYTILMQSCQNVAALFKTFFYRHFIMSVFRKSNSVYIHANPRKSIKK